MRCVLLLVFLLLQFHAILAQFFSHEKNYNKYNLQNPMDIAVSLAGNYGECRPNHFHSGIDLRTQSKENIPVRSIDYGFVSRVKIETGGFGNAIYVTHPDGITSVYAHLNLFYPALEKYIRKIQYENKSWKTDVTFLPTQFPVSKGQLIAWSGNTGSSQGPHLHLEIRDTKTENPLNPLLFFKNIKDSIKPILKKIAIYDANNSIYMQKPQIITVQKSKKQTDTIYTPNTKVYFAIQANDFIQNTQATLGIYEMRMYVNDKPHFAWQMNNISYDITRYMNAHADYKTKKQLGMWFQLCHKLKNDQLKIYKSFQPLDGIVELNSNVPQKIKIELYDVSGNFTQHTFYVLNQYNKNYIQMTCLQKWKATAGEIFKVNEPNIKFEIPATALYDDVCVDVNESEYSSEYSFLYKINTPDVPLHNAITLMLKPKKEIPELWQGKVVIAKRNNDNTLSGIAANKADKGFYTIECKEFGNYIMVIDKQAPNISCNMKTGANIKQVKNISFVIKEDITTVKNVTASVNGQWLRLSQKGSTYTYNIDDFFPQGTHTIQLTAQDENNNIAIQNFTFTK